MEPTREQLLDLCERGVVPQKYWHNRDSADAQIQLSKARTLLLAGCEFRVAPTPETTDETWWIEIVWEGFQYFELGGEEWKDVDTFYIPTDKRLKAAEGKDWY